MKKKVVKKKTKESNEEKFQKTLKDYYDNAWNQYLSQPIYSQILSRPAKKLTKKQLEQQKKEEQERKIREKKEQKRRAKKITMTVGEYEDAIEKAREEAIDYDW